MSGKGSGRRPTEVSEQSFADNWSRIFGQSGCSSTAEQGSLTPPVVRSNRTAPAITDFSALAHIRTEAELDAYVEACIDYQRLAEVPLPLGAKVVYVDDATGT